MMEGKPNYFAILNRIDVGDKTEKKGGLTYLSWAWAWAELKKLYPESTYTIYENADGLNYHTDGNTCWVKTGVTVNGIEHIEYLPVMDFKNKSIPLADITSFDVNKAIQRSLTKAVARHGLGLYIYAGEDLPEDAVIDKKAVGVLQRLLNEAGDKVNLTKFLEFFEIKDIAEMKASRYNEACQMINKAIQTRTK